MSDGRALMVEFHRLLCPSLCLAPFSLPLRHEGRNGPGDPGGPCLSPGSARGRRVAGRGEAAGLGGPSLRAAKYPRRQWRRRDNLLFRPRLAAGQKKQKSMQAWGLPKAFLAQRLPDPRVALVRELI